MEMFERDEGPTRKNGVWAIRRRYKWGPLFVVNDPSREILSQLPVGLITRHMQQCYGTCLVSALIES